MQFIAFAIIHSIMMFIWTFAYLNRSNNRLNQAFLSFLSVIILWMILSVGDGLGEALAIGPAIKTVYFVSMLNMSLFFLYFTYRLLARKLDWLFWGSVVVNTLTIISRYLFPIDYSEPEFWRMTHPVVAPVMAGIFSLPLIVALGLMIWQYGHVSDRRRRHQLRYVFIGISIAGTLSVVSEYALPALFGINTHFVLMYVAILVLTLFLFAAIMRYNFLSIQSDYIYRRLFFHSMEGIVLIDKHERIVNVNNTARQILHAEDMDVGDKITDYIADYAFDDTYRQRELVIRRDDQTYYATMTQHPIDLVDPYSVKLMALSDITDAKRAVQRDQAMLIQKAVVDPLTGLYNRQYLMDNYLADDHCPDDESQITLMFLDVDGLKRINDQYGHLFGDHVLQLVAGCICKNIRKHEKAIRFGGDEFVVVLSGISIDDAYRIAERIRMGVKALDFSDHGVTLTLTMSIGLIEGSASMKELITCADSAMYRSKIAGKDRTTIFNREDG